MDMWPWHMHGIVEISYILLDLVIILAAVFFCIALIKLYHAYGKPRSILILSISLCCFILGCSIEILYITSLLQSSAIYIANTLIIAAGAILAACSIIYTLRYLLSVAKLDSLTGIYNRRYFVEILQTEIARSGRYDLRFVLLYGDIDDFKAINDLMGHSIGDVVLRRVARKLTDFIRASDVVARWGGDEFVILFPQTDIKDAYDLLRHLGNALNELKMTNPKLSMSCGLVSYPEDGDKADKLINLADHRMYEVKKEKKQVQPLNNQTSPTEQ